MRNNKGFTLIEIIAVLLILGILAVIAVPKFMNLNVGDKMITQVVSELTTREKLTWINTRLAGSLTEDAIDSAVFSAMSYDVGAGATWVAGPGKEGGTIRVDNATVSLTRKPSTLSDPATWSR